MKNFKIVIIAISSILSAFLAACGSDSGTGSGIAQAETVYGLGECEKSNEGVIKLVTSENRYYKCVNGAWEEVVSSMQSSSSKSSQDKKDSTKKLEPPVNSSSSKGASSSFSLPVEIVNGVMVDSRDGKEYLTVTIGEQTWMAENLDFEYEVDGDIYGSEKVASSYTEPSSGVIVYPGRRYTIGAAIDSAAIYSEAGKGCGCMTNCLTVCDSEGNCTLGENVRGICPEGWHLPSNAEWVKLIETVGGDSIASVVLVSKEWGRNGMVNVANIPKEWDWNDVVDVVNFHATPDGCYYGECGVGFWSATGFIFSDIDIERAEQGWGGRYGIDKDFFYTLYISSSRIDENTRSHGVNLGFDESSAQFMRYFIRCIKNE